MNPRPELNKVYHGNALSVLKTMPGNFVDVIVTSPPYWGLRDYGTGTWMGGDENCNHRYDTKNANPDWRIQTRATIENGVGDEVFKDVCKKCGAQRIDEQLGLEKTPEEYVEKLVLIMRECRRVLKPHGTLWLNLGDSYVSSKSRYSTNPQSIEKDNGEGKYGDMLDGQKPDLYYHPTLKDKDLVGIPWRVAFALQADGWWLRSDNIWSKPNPMPESVGVGSQNRVLFNGKPGRIPHSGRTTKAHEYIFMLTKSERYFYDMEAIKEPMAEYERQRRLREKEQGLDSVYKLQWDGQTGFHDQSNSGVTRNLKRRHELAEVGTANKRSVWDMATKPFPGAHFATFPQDLPEICIKAGSSEKGVCATCGKPWERVVEKIGQLPGRERNIGGRTDGLTAPAQWDNKENPTTTTTLGWLPSCECHGEFTRQDFEGETYRGYMPHIPLEEHPIVAAIVMDPFAGGGTTCVVAEKLNRDWVAIELKEKYIREIIEPRLHKEIGLFNKANSQ